jgi:hypothetical protein
MADSSPTLLDDMINARRSLQWNSTVDDLHRAYSMRSDIATVVRSPEGPGPHDRLFSDACPSMQGKPIPMRCSGFDRSHERWLARARWSTMIRIGTAGWSVHARYGDRVPPGGSHLERYARVLDAVEINSSFYRPHKRGTYERWAAAVPQGFRFAVKLPKAVTHQARLVGAGHGTRRGSTRMPMTCWLRSASRGLQPIRRPAARPPASRAAGVE